MNRTHALDQQTKYYHRIQNIAYISSLNYMLLEDRYRWCIYLGNVSFGQTSAQVNLMYQCCVEFNALANTCVLFACKHTLLVGVE